MSRVAMKAAVIAAAATLLPAIAEAQVDSHMDRGLVPGSCKACHLGHGESRSPMLSSTLSGVCLSCHGTQTDRDRMVGRGLLSPSARPPLLGTSLSLPFTHEIDPSAMSRHQPNVVTCTSCHSPHRSVQTGPIQPGAFGGKKPSPRASNRFEYELCHECHGEIGASVPSRTDIRRLVNPTSRSYHPLESPSNDRSASVESELSGGEINCTDCHGNREPAGARGPHGSTVAFVLGEEYSTADGSPESATAYALCYRCHGREQVLDSQDFPEHRRHVAEVRASCSTCHNPHGSVDARSLIRFGEQSPPPGVSPSLQSQQLRFVSTAPGSGYCYLTCHGHDHGPATYGGAQPMGQIPLDW